MKTFKVFIDGGCGPFNTVVEHEDPTALAIWLHSLNPNYLILEMWECLHPNAWGTQANGAS